MLRLLTEPSLRFEVGNMDMCLDLSLLFMHVIDLERTSPMATTTECNVLCTMRSHTLVIASGRNNGYSGCAIKR